MLFAGAVQSLIRSTFAQRVQDLRLSVMSGNEKAISVYKGIGFELLPGAASQDNWERYRRVGEEPPDGLFQLLCEKVREKICDELSPMGSSTTSPVHKRRKMK